MKYTNYYCAYCKQYMDTDFGAVPCDDCRRLLRSTLKEQTEFNDFSRYGQIYKVPRTVGFSEPVANGEIKPVLHFMKRVARKQLTK